MLLLKKYLFNIFHLMYILGSELFFPPVDIADEDGVVAIGGDLTTERLLLAYQSGIFPWYNDDEPILWHSPKRRFVLFPQKLKVSKSMKTVLQNNRFLFTINKAFEKVIAHCKTIDRDEQDGTWITNEMKEAYINLNKKGIAISAETWNHSGELVGGLYGVQIGNIFCGESMFSKESNASKFAFIKLLHYLVQNGCILIDCQVYTPHLESLGAEMISREEYLNILKSQSI